MAYADLHFFFLQDPATDRSGTAGEAAKYVNATPIRSVKDMVYRIFERIGQTKGRIKTLVIMGHGLDDPSGPDDPAMFISIGEDKITAEGALKNGYLLSLAAYFQPDALVRLSGCKVGTSQKLLQAFSAILGGVKVEGWTGGISVCDSRWCYIMIDALFHRGIMYRGEQVICTWNKCLDLEAQAAREYRGEPKHGPQ